MLKVIGMMKRKPGLSFEEFKDHYESVHAPMGRIAMANADRYFRRYLYPMSKIEMDQGLTDALTSVASNPDVLSAVEQEYDVVVEMWFANSAEFDKAFRAMGEPEALKMYTDDTEKFLDVAKSRMYVVEEVETDFGRS